jgi:lysyl-tRNA synthetase class 2
MEQTAKNQIKCNDEYTYRTAKTTDLIEINQSAWSDSFSTKRWAVSALKKENFTDNEGLEYTTSGRIKSIREHGKSVFITFSDSTDTIQAYTKNDLDKNVNYRYIKRYIDIGDIVEIMGTLFLTKTAEKTVRITSIKLLSKCLHFIPDDYTGLENIEIRYRKRYLDILVNKNVKTIFEKRTYLIQHIRRFLDTQGYLEVETPMLHPIPGGALAKPFVTHHNALDTDLYLRIAPELYLKRMIVAGFEKVYEINKNFRNEGVSIRHNPEFTMLEFYTAFQDYHWAMNFVEEILRTSCFHLNQSYQVEWNGNTVDFFQPFDRLTAKDVIIKYTSITENDLLEDNINGLIDDIQKRNTLSYQEKIFYIFEEHAEKKLVKPTFLIDFPIELSPLAKANPTNPLLACRFELFICGMEIANGYNELNNPLEQAKRFKEQATQKNNGNDEAMHFDSEFIDALEYGMPPTAGVGIGIDRLCMLLTGAKSIKDVILFPTMKRL